MTRQKFSFFNDIKDFASSAKPAGYAKWGLGVFVQFSGKVPRFSESNSVRKQSLQVWTPLEDDVLS